MSNITGHEQCLAALEALGQHAHKQLEELSAAITKTSAAALDSFAAKAQRIQDAELAKQKDHYEKLLGALSLAENVAWLILLGISLALNIILLLLLVKR